MKGKNNKLYISECVSIALSIQHTKRTRLIISSYVLWLSVLYFFTVAHKLHVFLKKGRHCKLYEFFYFLYKLLQKYLNRIRQDVNNVHLFPVFLSDLNEKEFFSTVFFSSQSMFFFNNPSSGIRVIGCGRTEGRTATPKGILVLPKSAKDLI
jgi:hypothetical protein